MQHDYCMAMITTPTQAMGEKIANHLLNKKLAACVNIIDGMNSMYMWDGELQDDREVVLIAKTTENRVEDLIDKVKSNHSYDCPCILSIPVEAGNPDFVNWISEEVKKNVI